MSSQDLFQEFEKMCQDESTHEQDFQVFLENHTQLIPRYFLEHHGVDLNTVYLKVPFGTNYKSDFMLISKNSPNWTCIHIEIEDPRKKIFKNDDGLTADYNNARLQVKEWQVWLAKPENAIAFKQNIEKALLSNMRDKTIEHKFVLIYGRRSELSGTQRTDLWRSEKTDTCRAATWDSLFDGTHNTLNVAKFVDQKIHFISCPHLIPADLFVGGFLPTDFEMPANVVEQMIESVEDEQMQIKNDPAPDFSRKQRKKTIDAVRQIKTFKE